MRTWYSRLIRAALEVDKGGTLIVQAVVGDRVVRKVLNAASEGNAVCDQHVCLLQV
jgi:hypothetical protein